MNVILSFLSPFWGVCRSFRAITEDFGSHWIGLGGWAAQPRPRAHLGACFIASLSGPGDKLKLWPGYCPHTKRRLLPPPPLSLFREPARTPVPLWRGSSGLGVAELPLVRFGHDLNTSLKLFILKLLPAFRKVTRIVHWTLYSLPRCTTRAPQLALYVLAVF